MRRSIASRTVSVVIALLKRGSARDSCFSALWISRSSVISSSCMSGLCLAGFLGAAFFVAVCFAAIIVSGV
jgi:hypothetical protein